MAAYTCLGLPCRGVLPCLSSPSRPQHLLLKPHLQQHLRLRRPPSSPSVVAVHLLLKVSATGNEKGGIAGASSGVDVSVFRFALGIPGFDDSQLPRFVGFGFGTLLLLNHFLGAEEVTEAQLRSEVLGLFLAVVAVYLPKVDEILKGTRSGKVATLGSADQQVFILACQLTNVQKEELAWGSYALLSNTNTIALAIWYDGLVCVRGCWQFPKENRVHALRSLEEIVRRTDILGSTTSLYIPTRADWQGQELIPKGVVCLLSQPFSVPSNGTGHLCNLGYIILLSKIPDGYSEKDRAWISSLGDKFSKIAFGVE